MDQSPAFRFAQSGRMNLQQNGRLATSSQLIQALRERLEIETGQTVTMMETHISWVLLVGPSAYKAKKPVRFSFVDFSALASRKHFCEEEVRLNRRLANNLYLGVVSVCGTPAAPYLGDCAEPLDFAVHMRRFPPGALLGEVTRAGIVTNEHVDGLAQLLAAFHLNAPVVAPSLDWGSARHIARTMSRVFNDLRAHCDDRRLEPLLNDFEKQMRPLRSAWSARRTGGAVRECHGDLHLDNAVLIDGRIVPFDCIEFDPALRFIDVMNDTAFLTMDLHAHGRSDLAFRLLDRYLQATGDYSGLSVLRPYEIYRACVRALVAQLRQGSGVDEIDYLGCAQRLLQQQNGAARLMITHGLSGSGKSTVAAQLLESTGAIRVRSDVERKRMFGLDARQSSAEQGVDIYTAAANTRTYDRLAECAAHALRAGYPVIVDAAFLRRGERSAFQALATEMQVPFTILHCRAAKDQLRRRVAARSALRDDPSEAGMDVLERQFRDVEPLVESERAAALEVDTGVALDIRTLGERWCARSR